MHIPSSNKYTVYTWETPQKPPCISSFRSWRQPWVECCYRHRGKKRKRKGKKKEGCFCLHHKRWRDTANCYESTRLEEPIRKALPWASCSGLGDYPWFAFTSNIIDPFPPEVLHRLYSLRPRLLQEYKDAWIAPRAARCSLLPKQLWAGGQWMKLPPRKPFLMWKSTGQVYEQKSPLAMATAFSELCDKHVILVHVSFFARITQAHVKQ